MVATDSALALPDQDQAERGQRGAVAGPLDLLDHEARWRPVDHTGALADPQQADGQREQAKDKKQSAHGFSSFAIVRAAIAQGRPEWRARSPRARAEQVASPSLAAPIAQAQKSPGRCRGF